ncbi:MAG: hypothetical protein NTW32_14340 [Chloroflexi bacterium]|nr:hypothetical protein [Chloroflexota bacterium]
MNNAAIPTHTQPLPLSITNMFTNSTKIAALPEIRPFGTYS